jgi:hypothetical protein
VCVKNRVILNKFDSWQELGYNFAQHQISAMALNPQFAVSQSFWLYTLEWMLKLCQCFYSYASISEIALRIYVLRIWYGHCIVEGILKN